MTIARKYPLGNIDNIEKKLYSLGDIDNSEKIHLLEIWIGQKALKNYTHWGKYHAMRGFQR